MINSNRTKPKLWTKDFIIMALATFCLALMYFITMTTVAGYVMEVFGSSQSKAGLAASIFVLGVIIGRLFTGKYLEIIGRTKLLYIGLFSVFVMTLLYFPVSNLNVLIGVRFVHGIVVGIAISVLQIAVMNIIPIKRQAEGISIFSLSLIFGAAIGPFLGIYFIERGHMEIIFIFCTTLSVVAILLSFFATIPKIEVTPEQLSEMKGFHFHHFFEKKALPITGMFVILSMCYSGILSFIATYSMEIGLMSAASFFFIVYSISIILSRPLSGRTLDTKGDNIVMYPALLSFSASLIVLSQVNHGIVLLLAAVLAGLGFGNLQSATQAIAVKVSPPHRVSVATTTFHIGNDLGLGIGPFLLGFLVPMIGYRSMYFVLAFVVAACACIYYLVHGKKKPVDEQVTQAS